MEWRCVLAGRTWWAVALVRREGLVADQKGSKKLGRAFVALIVKIEGLRQKEGRRKRVLMVVLVKTTTTTTTKQNPPPPPQKKKKKRRRDDLGFCQKTDGRCWSEGREMLSVGQ